MYLLFCFMANILEGKISPLVFSSSWSLILFSTWVGLESILSCSPRGSSVHGILQARILEWVAMPFLRGSSDPGIKHVSPEFVGRFFSTWEAPRKRMHPTQLELFTKDPCLRAWAHYLYSWNDLAFQESNYFQSHSYKFSSSWEIVCIFQR